MKSFKSIIAKKAFGLQISYYVVHKLMAPHPIGNKLEQILLNHFIIKEMINVGKAKSR